MAVLPVVNTPPYGSEGPCNAFRLADALALHGEHVNVCLMGDGMQAARAGQAPREAHAPLEQMLVGLLERGVSVVCCGTSCRVRGVVENDLADSVTLATIQDLAEAVVQCERTLSF